MLPPDAARQLLAWIECAEPGEHMLVTVRKEEGGKVAIQMPAWYNWGLTKKP